MPLRSSGRTPSPRLTHDLHSADGAGVALHVPAPHGHGVPLLQREHLVGAARLGDGGARVRSGDARIVSVLHVGHGWGREEEGIAAVEAPALRPAPEAGQLQNGTRAPPSGRRWERTRPAGPRRKGLSGRV